MSMNIAFEQNSMRLSNRTDIPLKVDIQNTVYKSIDFSLSGISIYSHEHIFQTKKIYPATVYLDLDDAYLSIKTKLECIYTHKNRTGFRFLDLSEKNKKLLRRYIELFSENKLDKDDEFINIYKEPEVGYTIDEPIKFTDQEESRMKILFLRKSIFAFLFTLLVILSISGLLYFKYIYFLESTGSITDNYTNIYSPADGIIEKVFVKKDDMIKKNTPLFKLNGEELLYKLKTLKKIKKSKLQNKINYKPQLNLRFEKKVLSIKKKIFQNQIKKFKEAKLLLQKHMITKQEYFQTETKLNTAKEDYLIYKSKLLNKLKEYKNRFYAKKSDTKDLDLKIFETKKELEKLNILSPVNAKVYSINTGENQRVIKNQILATVWLKNTPVITTVLPSKELSNIKLNSKVIVVDPQTNKRYRGHVEQIKHRPNDPNTNNMTVFILPEKNAKELKPDSLVKVIFKRDLF